MLGLVGSFCHAHKICGGHKRLLLEFFTNIPCVRAASKNVAPVCHRRAHHTAPQCVLVLPGPNTTIRGLTVSLRTVISFKFPLQPHQRYYQHTVSRMWLFMAYSDEMIILPILATSLVHFSLKSRLGESVF